MASAVDIANLALARLGDDATLSSIDPPEGSNQADHCARFYPIARDTLLEMHPWNFASKRSVLAEITMPWSTWQYAYMVPNQMLKALAVLAPDAPDDNSTPYALPYSPQTFPPQMGMGYQPQPFVLEANSDDRVVLYTNQANAVLRYIARVTDTTRYPPSFVDALAWLLTSHLAGPIVKGDMGAQLANTAYQAFQRAALRATTLDAQQRKVPVAHNVPWISNR